MLIITRASMGPRSEERGKTDAAVASAHRESLQWGRVPKNAERAAAGRSLTAHSPLQWGRVPKNAESVNRGGAAFHNGELQWGRVPKNAERGYHKAEVGLGEYRFNGAAFRRTRKDTIANDVIGYGPSFNGAAFRRTRKEADVTTRGSGGFEASMGPRSEERGKSGKPVQPYNEATVLQWGRVPKNAESAFDGFYWVCCGVASMGPRSEERGK